MIHISFMTCPVYRDVFYTLNYALYMMEYYYIYM